MQLDGSCAPESGAYSCVLVAAAPQNLGSLLYIYQAEAHRALVRAPDSPLQGLLHHGGHSSFRAELSESGVGANRAGQREFDAPREGSSSLQAIRRSIGERSTMLPTLLLAGKTLLLAGGCSAPGRLPRFQTGKPLGAAVDGRKLLISANCSRIPQLPKDLAITAQSSSTREPSRVPPFEGAWQGLRSLRGSLRGSLPGTPTRTVPDHAGPWVFRRTPRKGQEPPFLGSAQISMACTPKKGRIWNPTPQRTTQFPQASHARAADPGGSSNG